MSIEASVPLHKNGGKCCLTSPETNSRLSASKARIIVTPFPELTPEEKRVLNALSERAGDGYSLLSRTGLNLDQLESATQKLIDLRLIAVEGEIHGDRIGKAYLWVPPEAQGKVEYLLGKLMAY
jgi:hypothetical protein